MEFIIEAPCYYSKHYELEHEIVELSHDLKDYMQQKNYSNIIKTIDIYPVVAPCELLEEGLWKEWVKISKSINEASVFKQIDYNSYINGTVEERKELTIKCVLAAVWDIKKKLAAKFNAEQLEKDILEFSGYSKAALGLKIDRTAPKEHLNWQLELSGEEIFNVSWDLIQKGLTGLIQTDDDSYLTLTKNFDQPTKQFLQTALPTMSSGLPPLYSIQTAVNTDGKIDLYEIEMADLKDVIAFFKDYYNGKEIDLTLFSPLSFL